MIIFKRSLFVVCRCLMFVILSLFVVYPCLLLDAHEVDDEDPKQVLEGFKKDQKLQCIVFAIDAERERISLKLSE